MKAIHILSAIVFVLMSSSHDLGMRAQTPEEVMMAISDLKEQKQSLISDTTAILHSIDSLNPIIKNLDTVLDGKNQELQKLQSNISNTTLERLKNEVESLVIQVSKLRAQYEEQVKSRDTSNRSLQNAKSEVKNMEEVYADAQREEAYRKNKLILDKAYSLITDEQISELLSTCGQFSKMPDFDTYIKRVQAASDNKKLYDEAINAIDSPFDEKRILDLRNRLRPLLDLKTDDFPNSKFKLSDSQYAEFDEVDIALSRFNGGVKELQSIIKSINNDPMIVGYRVSGKSADRKAAKNALAEYINPDADPKMANTIKRYFDVVPYLGKAFKKYRQELQENPFKETSVEMEILSFVTY